MNNMQRQTAAICLSLFGAAFLIVAGLWPVDDAATAACAVLGWAAFALAAVQIRRMGPQ